MRWNKFEISFIISIDWGEYKTATNKLSIIDKMGAWNCSFAVTESSASVTMYEQAKHLNGN